MKIKPKIQRTEFRDEKCRHAKMQILHLTRVPDRFLFLSNYPCDRVQLWLLGSTLQQLARSVDSGLNSKPPSDLRGDDVLVAGLWPWWQYDLGPHE